MRRYGLLAPACGRGLHPHNHATVVVHQIVVVVTEASRRGALGRIGGIIAGRRHLILFMHRLFHRILLFYFLAIYGRTV